MTPSLRTTLARLRATLRPRDLFALGFYAFWIVLPYAVVAFTDGIETWARMVAVCMITVAVLGVILVVEYAVDRGWLTSSKALAEAWDAGRADALYSPILTVLPDHNPYR